MSRKLPTYSTALAERMCKAFAAKKLELLRKAAFEAKTKAQVSRLLELKYRRMTHEFLRADGSTLYGDWLRLGPRAELEEIREALAHEHVWDQLLDRATREIRRAA